MQASKRNLLWAALLGGTLLSWAPAMAADHPHRRADPGPRDVHVGIHEGRDGRDFRVGVHAGRGNMHFRAVDRFHRVPPDVRARGFHGNVHVRITPFHNYRGWHVNRFTPAQRAMWRHGHWWHGRHNGRFGWWWWVDGGWFWYDAPIYPYPGYVSDYVYEEPSEDYGDYWYYCRDPEGYYPYVQQCNRAWEPVPAQPEMNGPGYGPGDQDQYDDQGPGPDDEDMGPDDQGPPDESGPYDQGPPDEQGPPDDQGYPDDQGPPPPPHG